MTVLGIDTPRTIEALAALRFPASFS